MRQVFHFSPFYSWRHWSSEKWSNLPDITQLESGQTWAWTLLWPQTPCPVFLCQRWRTGKWSVKRTVCWRSVLPQDRKHVVPFLVSTPVPSSGPFCPGAVMIMLPGKLLPAFIVTPGFHLSPWTWMFLDPGVFKHSYLPLAVGVMHFWPMLSLFPVVWCRGLEWDGRDWSSDLFSAAPASWSKSLNFRGAQGTITSVLSPWKSFQKCSVVQ